MYCIGIIIINIINAVRRHQAQDEKFFFINQDGTGVGSLIYGGSEVTQSHHYIDCNLKFIQLLTGSRKILQLQKKREGKKNLGEKLQK